MFANQCQTLQQNPAMSGTEEEERWGTRLNPVQLFRRFGKCVVRVQVTVPRGDIGNGTGFTSAEERS